MASAKPEEYVKRQLACLVCMETRSDPRALPCLHTFCLPCLQSYIASLGLGNSTPFECPVCRARTNPPSTGTPFESWAHKFPSNHAVKAFDENNVLVGDINIRSTIDKEYTRSLCNQHPKTPADFFCSHHAVVMCSTCVTQYHQKCEHVISLTPDASDKGNHSQSDLYHESTLSDSQKDLATTKDHEELSTNKSIVSNDDADENGESGKAAKRKLTRLFDAKIEPFNIVTNSGEQDKDSQRADGACARKIKENKPLLKQNSLSIGSKTHNEREMQPIDQTHSFSVLNDILEEDRTEPIIKKVTVSSSQLKLHDEFYVRIQDDKKCCSIIALTFMTNGTILLADETNENLKLFTTDGVYVCHLCLTSSPWDVASIEQFEVVVTLPNEKCIQFILVDGQDGMSITRQVQLDKQCFGVSFFNRQLYVAMDNEIRILTYDGYEVKKIGRSSNRRLLFMLQPAKPMIEGAHHLVIDRQHKHPIIYVSCVANNNSSLVAMDRKGGLISVIKSGGTGRMYGVSVCSDGRLLVCQSAKTLVMVSVDRHGSRSREILEVENLQTAQFDPYCARVYVSRRLNGFIRVYTF